MLMQNRSSILRPLRCFDDYGRSPDKFSSPGRLQDHFVSSSKWFRAYLAPPVGSGPARTVASGPISIDRFAPVLRGRMGDGARV